MKLNAQKFLAALSLVVMVSACGKSMNLQVQGQKVDQSKVTNPIVTGKEGGKIAPTGNVCGAEDAGSKEPSGVEMKLTKTLVLEDLSAFDQEELKGLASEGSISKRAIFQVAPKEAIKEVLALELTLNDVEAKDFKNVSLCTETACHQLALTAEKTPELKVNLVEAFGLSGKSQSEIADWIYANTKEFARPGYRKLRLNFVGIEQLKAGNVNLQVITNEKLPKDFAQAPQCFIHGDEDRLDIEAAPGDSVGGPDAGETGADAPADSGAGSPSPQCDAGMVMVNGECTVQ